MGSPEFAVPSLEALVSAIDVVGVVTQPDRPAGRGKTLTPPPVKQKALEFGLPIFQPERLHSEDAFTRLESWAPELIVVTAYGQILRQNVLDLPRFGCLNLHASLLPLWRGAAPVQAALLHGDSKTGVSIMKMDAGVDTGAVLAQVVELILAEDNAETLSKRLANRGASFLIGILPDYLEGIIQPREQDESLATYAPMLKKRDGELDFSQPAKALFNKIRAFNPWPGAYTYYEGNILKIPKASVIPDVTLQPGERGIRKGLPVIGCGDGMLALEVLQPAGKKPMAGGVFLHGARDWIRVL